MSRKKIPYLHEDDLLEEYYSWLRTGQVSERMGRYMLMLAQHVMSCRSFVGYPAHMKDDMISDGVVKIMKNLHNYNQDKGTLFSYWTRCVFTSSIDYLSHHYKDINRRKEYLIDALRDAQLELPSNPNAQVAIAAIEQELARYATNKDEDEEGRIE